MILLILLLTLSSYARATPSINLPINAQVPPVAQVNQSYNFVFAPSTFSDTNSINYTLSNSTDWLQLDSNSRTFSGTPGSQDVGSSVVLLVATDGNGSVSMPVTFIVSSDQGPGIGTPVAAQLPAYGAFSSPDSLLLTLGSALSLMFSQNTFTNTNKNTSYYAKSADNTPLPSWVIFDSGNLTFSGKVPQATSPNELPQTVGIQLTASNVMGFAQAVASFQLIIQSHMFAFGNTLQVIAITPGSPVSYDLMSDLSLDDQPVNASDVYNTSTDAPSWLSLDQKSLVLTGTPPANTSAQNFTVSATDRYGDLVSTIVFLQVTMNSSLDILMPFPILNATIGAPFVYDLNDSLSCDPDSAGVDFIIDPGTAAGWLTYNSTSMTLYGYVPTSLKPQNIQVNVTGTQGNQSQSEILSIVLSCANGTPCQTTSSNGARPTATTSTEVTSSTDSKNRAWIAAAVILPVFAVITALLLLTCCCRRNSHWRLKLEEKRKKLKVKKEKEMEKKEDLKLKISGPQPGKQIRDESGTLPEPASTSNADQEKAIGQSPDAEQAGPPGMNPGVAGYSLENQKRAPVKSIKNRFSRFRLSKVVTDSNEQATRPDSWQRYIRGLEPQGSKTVDSPEFSLVPEEQSPPRPNAVHSCVKPSLAVSGPSMSTDASPTKRLSKRRKRVSGMFSGPRVSGLGHGRNALSQGSSNYAFGSKGVGHGDSGPLGGPPGYGVVRKSWRNLSVISWTTTQSPPDSGDPVIWEGLERRPTQKSFASILSLFPDPSTSGTIDKHSRPQTIHEAIYGEGAETSIRPMRSLPRSHVPVKRESPSPFPNGTTNESLQVFHKRRRQHGSLNNPFLSAGPSSSRVPSLQNPSSQKRETDGKHTLPVTPHKETIGRSYSQSSSLGSEFKVSPPRTSNSLSSPVRKKSRPNYNFATRALSPQFKRSSRPFSRYSFSSNSTDSRFESAASEAGYNEALHEETDHEGNKVWKHTRHPNPLRLNSTDVTDQELIDSLRAAGQFNAAQRLSVLKARSEGIGAETDANVEVSSPLGKRWRQNTGLTHGDPSNTSMRGIVRDAGDSAFI